MLGFKPTNAMTRDELVHHMRTEHGVTFSRGVRLGLVDEYHIRSHKDAADGLSPMLTDHVHRGDLD